LLVKKKTGVEKTLSGDFNFKKKLAKPKPKPNPVFSFVSKGGRVLK
jgi:hypothetical protein